MKQILLYCFFAAFVTNLPAQDVYREYYSFSSVCQNSSFTINTAEILTLKKDSSFILEVIVNTYDWKKDFTKTTFSGSWHMKNNQITLQFFNRQSKTSYYTAGNNCRDFFVCMPVMPVIYIVDGENIFTNAMLFSNMNTAKDKVRAVVEKGYFKNAAFEIKRTMAWQQNPLALNWQQTTLQ